MLKMTIDNEEVVSDKDITINEEMLSASSTILNNVYPKEWEEDKDYTSRFYYPQDYSKALIQRSYVTQEAEAGTTIQVNGSVTLNDVDTTKNSRVLRLLGQTSQSGTPTPSSPIPVNVVSGDNEIVVNGKNFYKVDNTPQTTKNGITYSIENGTITLNGTASASTDIDLSTTYLLNANTYTISTNVISGSYTGTVGKYVRKKVGSGYSTILDGGAIANTRTPTTSESTDIAYSALYVANGATFSNYKINIQLEKGNQASAYEPYQGNTYNIDLPVENLFFLPNEETRYGVTYSKNADGTINISGTATNDVYFTAYVDFTDINLKNGEVYTFSANKTISSGLEFRYEAYNGNSWVRHLITPLDSTHQKNTKAINLSNGTRVRTTIYISNGATVNISNIGVQVEKGSKQNNFTPYGTTPIELCKIGNYQDYIYKDSDKWYLHKEIGKVVLNGSESGWGYDTTNQFFVTAFTGYLVSGVNIPYCDYYKGRIPVTAGANVQNNEIALSSDSTKLRVYVKNTSITSLANWKIWLGSNNISLYYILSTPTNTEITYQPLIDQLNALSSQ
jgi:hypothetical protein